jgi:hypothetical protein
VQYYEVLSLGPKSGIIEMINVKKKSFINRMRQLLIALKKPYLTNIDNSIISPFSLKPIFGMIMKKL